MPMGPEHDARTDPPKLPGVYSTKARGEFFSYWRYYTGGFWCRGYWTRDGCQQAVEDFHEQDVFPPREGGRVISWREVE